MKKLENLLNFEDFKANWKEKEPKKTKRTEIGLDVIEEKKSNEKIVNAICTHCGKKQTTAEKDYSLNNVKCKFCGKEGELRNENKVEEIEESKIEENECPFRKK